MKQVLSLENIRNAIKETQYPSVWQKVEKMTDERFQKASFSCDFQMDSLDVIEMTMFLERDLNVSIPDEAITIYSRKGGTVQAMIDAFNETVKG